MSNDKKNDDKTKKHINIHIDEKKYDAPKDIMTGAELKHLAEPPIGPDRDLFQEAHGSHDDIKIGDAQQVELKSGMRFYSAPKTINPGDNFQLPELDSEYLNLKGFKWELPQPGYLLLREVPVSLDVFDHAFVDVLIRIPNGYPTAALDMFYVLPELKLRSTGGHPTAASAFEGHIGRNWQRFSRHLAAGAWKPGRDSIKSFLALVLSELQGKR